AVDGEEAQAGDGDVVEFRVTVGQQFVGFLGGGVEGHGVVDAVVFGERDLVVHAVDGAGGGVDQVFDGVVAAAFQYGHHADEVGVDVGEGVFYGVAYAGLGGQVDDALELFAAEQFGHAVAVGQVEVDVAEVAVRRELGQAPVFEGRFVVAVEVVQTDDFVAFGQQSLGGVQADEAGGAGDQVFHPFQRSAVDFTKKARIRGAVVRGQWWAGMCVGRVMRLRRLGPWSQQVWRVVSGLGSWSNE